MQSAVNEFLTPRVINVDEKIVIGNYRAISRDLEDGLVVTVSDGQQKG